MEYWLSITGGVISIIVFLSGIAFWVRKWYLKRKSSKSMRPFLDSYHVKEATRIFIPTRMQNIPASDADEPNEVPARIISEKAIPWFLSSALREGKDGNRFYLILADSGMGKTTFLINLYLKYNQQVFRRKKPVIYIHLGSEQANDYLFGLQSEEIRNAIILLDAFDEDSYAVGNYTQRLENILNHIWQAQEIVLTCRSQFFPSKSEEPGKLKISNGRGGFHQFQKLYISPFREKDIRKYLRKKYPWIWNRSKRKKASQIAFSVPLFARPMLLNYIDLMVDSELSGFKISEIYDAMVHKWIDREAERIFDNKEAKTFKENMFLFSQKFAVASLKNLVSPHGQLSSQNMVKIAEEFGVKLNQLEMRSKSLLNRNSLDAYKFAHKSFWEFFLAQECLSNGELVRSLDWFAMDLLRTFFLEQYEIEIQYSPTHDYLGLRKAIELDSSIESFGVFISKLSLLKVQEMRGSKKTPQISDGMIQALVISILDKTRFDFTAFYCLLTLSALKNLYPLRHQKVRDLGYSRFAQNADAFVELGFSIDRIAQFLQNLKVNSNLNQFNSPLLTAQHIDQFQSKIMEVLPLKEKGIDESEVLNTFIAQFESEIFKIRHLGFDLKKFSPEDQNKTVHIQNLTATVDVIRQITSVAEKMTVFQNINSPLLTLNKL